MKRSVLWIAIIVLCFTGCDPKDEVTVLAGGYETVAHTQRSIINEPESLKVKLCYRAADGRQVLVWPVLRSEVFIRDGIALFVGDKTVGRSKLDNIWEMELRLFAVKAPAAPMDITSEVVGRWAKASGKDVATALKAAALLGAQTRTNELSCHFEFNGGLWAGTDILLDWNRISEVMQEVKEKGVVHKDPESGVIYLEKEFKPEDQK